MTRAKSVVDDDPDFVAYIRTMLESHDYSVWRRQQRWG
jgi:CheY-like chemotaxis protein